MSKNNKIFVQIASYRDPELIPTIKDCIAKAKTSDRLRFGICWQHDETENLNGYAEDERFRIIDCLWNQSKGVCWARHEIQKLYKGERYTLQLDSHHRFAPNWDEQLIEMMAQTGSKKPIITAHTPEYFPEQWEPGSSGPHDKDVTPYKIVPKSFTTASLVQLESTYINNWQTLLKPLHARFLSCHFFFTLGEFCLECQYDPMIYFNGQELNMTIRSFTAGYDIFHPQKSLVWHEYLRSGKPKHWDDHTEKLVQEKKIDISSDKRDIYSKNRMKQLLQQENCNIDLGDYGLGSARTLENYEKYAGIDFQNQRLHRDTLEGKEPPNSYINSEKWSTEFFDNKGASLKRAEYYRFFNQKGVKYPAAGNLSKPARGNLSPGCRTCIAGTWACIFITDACTRKCFYCPIPQSKRDNNRAPNGPEHITFDSVDDYIEYLKKFEFDGVSFSGGEPFLVVDRMLAYIKKTRECFGEKHYIWAYTNGDPVTDQNLTLLGQAGLNEVRFDISANNYDLTAVKKAVDHIETVTVEIPAIPEDIERLKSLLKEMVKIGVKHLNLHQLMRTKYNSGNFNQRCYSPVNKDIYPDFTPIMESEIAAYEILKHAIETETGLGINYCSRCYKARFQGTGHRKRATQYFKNKKFYLTETGYLSQLAMDVASDQAAFIIKSLSKDEWEVAVDGERSELLFSVEHLDLLLKESYNQVDVIYYEVTTTPENNQTTAENASNILIDNKICVQQNVKYRLSLENNTSAFLFYRLFVEGKNIESVVNELADLYQLDDDGVERMALEINNFYAKFQTAEYLPNNLEPYEY